MTGSLHRFQERAFDFIRRHGLIDPEDHILAAVSGGPDSMALLHVILSLQTLLQWGSITVLHLDHELRGEASAEDRAFVESTAARFCLPIISEKADVRSYKATHRVSLEMAARACRHRFFQESLTRLRARSLALGHTADDQAEEVLLRLLRGTGPSGLSGMLPKSPGGVIRPLLFATRRDVLEYIRDYDLPYREDASNQDIFCQRNALRIEVFPVLQERFHSRVAEVLCRHADLARDDEDFWRLEVERCWPSIRLEESENQIVMRRGAITGLHPAMLRRILRYALERFQGNLLGIYLVHIENLRKCIAGSTSGSELQLPGGIRARVAGDQLILSRTSVLSAEPFEWTLPGPGSYELPPFSIDLAVRDIPPRDSSLCASPDFPDPGSGVAHMDADRIQWPLQVRSWRAGDRFRPLGSGGSRKIQDLFTDLKVPRAERMRIPLFCDLEKICWVAGLRLDDRVKVTAGTKRLLVARIRRER